MSPLEVPSETPTATTLASTKMKPPGPCYASKHNNISKNSTTLPVVPSLTPVKPTPLRKSNPRSSGAALIITTSSQSASARQHSPPLSSASSSSSSSSSTSASSAESSPSSVTTVTTIESHSSASGPTPRGLIGEYLAAKSRSQQIPPPIFSPTVTSSTTIGNVEQQQQQAMAYKHPILLMDEDENGYGSVLSSVGNERNREVEVKLVEDNSIELLDATKDEELNEGEKESLIVPKPKMNAFHSSPPKDESPTKGGTENGDGRCRLVGKVNPNILKTWEQLRGGGIGGNDFCEHKRKNSRNSLITVTSSENSGDKQSCLIFYRNQYNVTEKPSDFTVTRIQHSDRSVSSTTIVDESTADPKTVSSTLSMVTSSTTTETSSEGCYDFYDSIDAGSSSGQRGGVMMMDEIEEDGDEYAMMAAGEGLADFTSLDRTKLMWSIDVE
ncbi:nuclear pore complex protein DDB_G0274915-like [Topomyia yanbarensis]|uniref:nuclear pore complex protein DDB_G0274915-like n=1 Tax=Topomyia yanbarensis TaxID=2498891 RepID=UPI00273B4020|nr:nuclear pore complex protein DDB_G0274915-like [Topomyia yanbarensis]